MGAAFFASKYQSQGVYGYFSVDWSQNEGSEVHTWVSNTFTGLLSSLGGYSTVLTGIFGLLISNYQSFVFDKSMLKKLYFMQLKQY